MSELAKTTVTLYWVRTHHVGGYPHILANVRPSEADGDRFRHIVELQDLGKVGLVVWRCLGIIAIWVDVGAQQDGAEFGRMRNNVRSFVCFPRVIPLYRINDLTGRDVE